MLIAHFMLSSIYDPFYFLLEGSCLAKKKGKQVQVASVAAGEVLMRDLKNTALWVGIAWMVVVVIATIYKSIS
jgi:hypothetical protein